MSGKRKVLGRFSWLMLEKIVSLGTTALIGFAIARHLGPNDFGLQNYVAALGAMALAVGNLGLNGLITRDLTYHPEEEGQILGTVSALTTSAMILITLGTALWVYLTPSIAPEIGVFTVLVVASCILRRFEFLESWFVVKSKVKPYAIARMAVVMLFVVIRIVLLILDAPLEAFLATLAGEHALSGIRSLVAYKLHARKDIRWHWSGSTASYLLKRSWPALISGILAFVYLRIDLIMLTWWSSPHEAGIYAAAAKLSEVWYFAPTIMMSAVFPNLLKLRTQNKVRYQKMLQTLLDGLCAAGIAVAALITIAAPWLIPFLYGASYSGAAPILMVHVWAGVFVFMRALLSKWLIAEELYILSLITHGLGAAMNIALNLLLIPKYGGMGAAVATALSYMVAGYGSLLFHRRTIGMFVAMSRSFLFVRRVPEAIRFVRPYLRKIRHRLT